MVEHRVTDGVTVTEDFRMDSNGRREPMAGHEVRANLGENRGTVEAEVTHSNDGSLSAEARYNWSEGENAIASERAPAMANTMYRATTPIPRSLGQSLSPCIQNR